MRTRVLALLALATFAVSQSFCFAQDANSKPAADTAQKPAADKAKAKAPRGPSKAVQLKFLGRFLQTNQWDKLEQRARVAYASDDLDLKSMGAWYLTLIAANNGAENEEILERLKEAVELGYKNPAEIETVDQLIPLRENAEFQKIVEDLWVVVRAEARAKFQDAVTADVALARERAGTGDAFGLGDLTEVSGGTFWRPGKPTVLMLTRVHHDGFHKLLPTMEAAFRDHGDGVAAAVLYYQFDGDDSGRKEQTLHEVKRLGIKWPVAIIDQGQKDAIEASLRHLKEAETDPLFFPAVVFLNPAGTPLLARKGLLLDWQATLLFERLRGTIGAVPTESPAVVDAAQAAQEAADAAEKAASDAQTAARAAAEAAAAAAPANEGGE